MKKKTTPTKKPLRAVLTLEMVMICKSLFINDMISPSITLISASGMEFTEYLHVSSHFWKLFFPVCAYHSDSTKAWINQGRISNIPGSFPTHLSATPHDRGLFSPREDKNPSHQMSKTGRICRSTVVIAFCFIITQLAKNSSLSFC